MKTLLILKTTLSGNTFRSFSKVFLANVINRVLLFVVYFLLARKLSVEEYGLFTISVSLIATLSALSNLGFSVTITRYAVIFKQEGRLDKLKMLFSSINWNLIAIGFAVVLIGFLFGEFFSQALFKESRPELIFVSTIGVPLFLIYTSYTALFTGLEKYNIFIAHSVFPNFFLLLFICVSIYFFEASNLLMLNIGFSLAPASIILLFWFGNKYYSYFDFVYSIKSLKETFSFSKWITLQTLVLIVQGRMDTYLLAVLTEPEQVSYYDVAFKFQGLILFIVGSFNTVIQPKITSLGGILEIRKFVGKIKVLPLIGSLGVVFVILIVPYVIEFIFSSKYNMSILPLRIMLVGVGLHLWIIPYNSALYAIGKSKVFFITVLLQLVANVLASLVLIPKYGAVGASISYMLINVVALFGSLIYYHIYVKINKDSLPL